MYGQHFAAGFPETAPLHEVLEKLDERSLSALVHDHEQGHLQGKIAHHS